MRFALIAKNDKIKVELDDKAFAKTFEEYYSKNKSVSKTLKQIEKELFRHFLHT